MKIYVVGSSKNRFLPLDNIREKFLIDEKHEGDNIDFLNPWYCELTGLYYLWKHVDDDIVGLEHYRTYFWKNGKPINEQEIKEELKNGDIICGSCETPITLGEEFYILTKGYSDKLLELIKEQDEKFYNFLTTYLQRKRFYWCNCFIGKKEIINEWCEYLFNLIASFEEKYSPKTSPLRREGFIGEYIFNAWLEYNNISVIHCDMNKFSKELDTVIRKATL